MKNEWTKLKAALRAVLFVNSWSKSKRFTGMAAVGSLMMAVMACQLFTQEPDPSQIVNQATATPESLVGDTSAPEATPSSAPDVGSAEDVNILSWDIGTDLDLDSFEIEESRDTFGPDETIYILLWTDSDATVDLPYEATWRNPDGVSILIEESEIGTGEVGWYLSGDPPAGGWEMGSYTVELKVEDELLEEWAFQVSADGLTDALAEEEGEGASGEQTSHIVTDSFDRDTGNWDGCEYCEWQDGQLTVGPWPIEGAYFQHNIVCIECGNPRFYRMGVDIIYEEGPSERGFGFLLKWNDDVLITAEVTPWQTMMIWRYEYSTEDWTLLRGDFFGAVKPGRQVNRLEVEVFPSEVSGTATMAVGVNGRKQIVLEGQPSANGLVGLTLFGHATAASFDDFEFELLDTDSQSPVEEEGGA